MLGYINNEKARSLVGTRLSKCISAFICIQCVFSTFCRVEVYYSIPSIKCP